MASGKNHDRGIYLATPIVLGVGWHYWGLEIGSIAASAHFKRRALVESRP